MDRIYKLKVLKILFFLSMLINYSLCIQRNMCRLSTYEDRRNEENKKKFSEFCSRRSGTIDTAAYIGTVTLRDCSLSGDYIVCCCSGIERKDCKPGSFINNGNCETCKAGSYSLHYAETECKDLPKEFENEKIVNVVPKDDIQFLDKAKLLAFYSYDIKEEGKLTDMKTIIGVKYNLQAVAGFDESSNSIIVSFRGTDNTENYKNLIQDLKFDKTSYSASDCQGCQVHLGFNQGYESLREPFLWKLKDYKKSILMLFYCYWT